MPRDPHPEAPGADAGITEAMIRDLVHAFYARVRRDPLIGPIFNAAVEDCPPISTSSAPSGRRSC
jgi:hemoglobin